MVVERDGRFLDSRYNFKQRPPLSRERGVKRLMSATFVTVCLLLATTSSSGLFSFSQRVGALSMPLRGNIVSPLFLGKKTMKSMNTLLLLLKGQPKSVLFSSSIPCCPSHPGSRSACMCVSTTEKCGYPKTRNSVDHWWMYGTCNVEQRTFPPPSISSSSSFSSSSFSLCLFSCTKTKLFRVFGSISFSVLFVRRLYRPFLLHNAVMIAVVVVFPPLEDDM